MHFWHILHLGNTSGRNNFNDFPDNQLTKFSTLHTGMAVGQKEVAVWFQADWRSTGIPYLPVYHTGAYRLTSSPGHWSDTGHRSNHNPNPNRAQPLRLSGGLVGPVLRRSSEPFPLKSGLHTAYHKALGRDGWL